MPSPLSKNTKNSEIEALHARACEQGERFYLDPETRYWVTTRVAHLERGYCCGNGCRHCPWDHEAVRNPPGSRIPSRS